jgi:CheY-like chemotaxis protein
MQTLRAEALPRRSPRAGTTERPDNQGLSRSGASGALPTPRPAWRARRLAGVTVVVVDDDPASLDYFAMALRTAGAVVRTAATAADALRLVQDERPDVVLSDIAMPGRDGYWLVGEIRRLAEPERPVPVIATTAYGRAHPRDRALAGGFVEHLSKPVDPDRLVATIAQAAGRA